MYQSVVMWNLAKKDEKLERNIEKIRYRGYNSEKYLTSQFANKITSELIKPLSVSNIADRFCPSGIDLYYEKGKNRSYRKRGRKKWGRTAGIVSQGYLSSLFTQNLKKRKIGDYGEVAKKIDKFSSSFKEEKKEKIQELDRLATEEYENPQRLLNILETNGRIEIGAKMIHNILSSKKKYMNPTDLAVEHEEQKIVFSPNPLEIGINISTPDFFIEKFKVVGDIKTGFNFDERYLLTCAGYALAYENWKKHDKKDINWGIIYFLPSRIPTAFAEPVTNAQLYIFLIDDNLRGWFLKERDDSYKIISENAPPEFPEDKENCKVCKYQESCKELGLEYENSSN